MDTTTNRAQAWSEHWDLSTIPEERFRSENGRRNNLLRKNKTGGVLWGHHVANYSRCRCARCMQKRTQGAAKKPKAKKPKIRAGSDK